MSGWKDEDDWGTKDNVKPAWNPYNPSQTFERKSPEVYQENDNELKIMVDEFCCGRIIGKRGSTIQSIESASGARVKVLKDSGDGGKVPVIISGTEKQKQLAQIEINKILENNNNNFEQRSNGYKKEDNELAISVDKDFCGKLIGKQGRNIIDIQSQTRATVKVHKNNSEFGKIPVTISGSKDCVQKAKKMIEEQYLIWKTESQSRYNDNSMSNNFNNKCQINGDSNDDNSSLNSNGFINWGMVINQSKENMKKKWENSDPLVKNFYIEDEVVASMLPNEVEAWREENNKITVVDLGKEKRKLFNPVMTFEQAFQHYPEILDTLSNQNFSKPSPIQSQLWPLALSGYDVIGIAQTGSGKTISFLLPAFVHIDLQPTPRSERKGPSALILTPTRELALQIENEINKYKYKNITCLCVYGGGNRNKQIGSLKGVDIIVATPGRFNDLVYNGFISLDSVSYLVLDEADRMLDMGFEPQIMKILLDVRPDRQTIMTSATWPEEVRHMGEKYMNDPVQVACGSLDLAAVHTVTQIIEMADEEEKMDKLKEFIDGMEENEKVLVFAGRKITVDSIATKLCLMDIDCQSIHGGREQCDREQALLDFKLSEVRILIATDVAARGLDVLDISHVLNYDCPKNMEEYVHRVGRTGRAGRSGISITLVTRKDWGIAEELIKILEEADQYVPSELNEMSERFKAMKERRARENAAYGGGGRRFGGRGGGRGGSGGRVGNRGGGFNRRNDRW